MGNNPREQFLTRIRLALAGEVRPAPPVTSEKRAARLARGMRPGGLEQFAGALEGLGVAYDLAANAAEAREAVVRALEAASAVQAAVWEHPLFEAVDLEGILAEHDVEALRPPQLQGAGGQGARLCPKLADAEIGITAADAALAASGTLILRIGAGRERAVSLLPPIHLAILAASNLYAGTADLAPLLESWSEDGLPSAVHCVTGPSSTGDIEYNLVKGMHGPLAVRVVVLAWL